jgi:hypothetical protein
MLLRANIRLNIRISYVHFPYIYETSVIAASIQAGKVVAHAEPPHLHHGEDHRSAEQPHLRPLHHHLHLCRHGHAALRQELHRYNVRSKKMADRYTFHLIFSYL